MIWRARRWSIAYAVLALCSCSRADPLDRPLPADRTAQDAIAVTLPEPQRNHYRIYLREIRLPAGSGVVPTVRQAIDAGRQRAADEVREMSDMRARLSNTTGSVEIGQRVEGQR